MVELEINQRLLYSINMTDMGMAQNIFQLLLPHALQSQEAVVNLQLHFPGNVQPVPKE